MGDRWVAGVSVDTTAMSRAKALANTSAAQICEVL